MKIKKIREIKSKVKVINDFERKEEFDKEIEETREGHFDETPSLEPVSLGSNFRLPSSRSLDSTVPQTPIPDTTNDETRNDEKKNDFRMYEIQRTFGNEANRYQPGSGGLNVQKAHSVSVRDFAQPRRDFFSTVDQPGANLQGNSNDEKYSIEKNNEKKEKKGHGYAWEY